MIVLKFGGTSVGDAEAIARAGRIVGTRADQGAVVVVSALAGVTNALIAIAEQAATLKKVRAAVGAGAMLFSSVTRQGVEECRDLLESWLEQVVEIKSPR